MWTWTTTTMAAAPQLIGMFAGWFLNWFVLADAGLL